MLTVHNITMSVAPLICNYCDPSYELNTSDRFNKEKLYGKD